MPQSATNAPGPEAIKTWREAAGLSQELAAARMGVHVMTWSKWERGISGPSPRSVRDLLRWRDQLVRTGKLSPGAA